MAAKTTRNSSIKKQKVKSHKNSMMIVTVLLLIVCGTMVFRTVGFHKEIQACTAQQQTLDQQIEDAQKHQEELEAEANYVKSDEYVEDIARDKLGLVYENEIIFKKR